MNRPILSLQMRKPPARHIKAKVRRDLKFPPQSLCGRISDALWFEKPHHELGVTCAECIDIRDGKAPAKAHGMID